VKLYACLAQLPIPRKPKFKDNINCLVADKKIKQLFISYLKMGLCPKPCWRRFVIAALPIKGNLPFFKARCGSQSRASGAGV